MEMRMEKEGNKKEKDWISKYLSYVVLGRTGEKYQRPEYSAQKLYSEQS